MPLFLCRPPCMQPLGPRGHAWVCVADIARPPSGLPVGTALAGSFPMLFAKVHKVKFHMETDPYPLLSRNALCF